MRLCHLGQQLMTSRTSRGISPDSYRLPQDKAALAVLVPRVYNSVRSLGESGMHKLIVAVAVLFVPVLSLAQQDFSKVEIKIQKVAGTVYMLQGSGGNIAVSVGDDGIIMVDDQFAPLAPKIQAALKSISDKPLRFLL